MIPKLFIFDLDGVITHTAEYHRLAWEKTAGDLGLEFTEELNEALKGISRLESLEKILRYHGVEERYTQEEKESIATHKNMTYQQLLVGITPTDYLPGIERLLKEIRSIGLPIALASASHNAPRILEQLDGLKYIDYIVNPKRVQRGKPSPDLFLEAARYFDVPSHECIGIEDAVSGIEAINRAGMFSVGVGKNLLHAHYRVNSTKDLNLNAILNAYDQKLSS